MLIYYSAALVSYGFLLFSRISENKILKNTLFLFCLFVMFSVAGLRYEVGSDFNSYYYYINKLSLDLLEIKFTEYGLSILGGIVLLFTDEGQFFIALTSIIIIYLILKTVYTYSKYPEISILLFFGLGFFFTSLNIVRQYIALAVIFYSIKYIFNNNIKRFIIAVLIASLFHITALVGFVFIVVYKFKDYKYVSKITLITTFLVILIFYENIINILLFGEYSEYISSRFINEGASIIFFLVYFSIAIFLSFFIKKLNKIDSRNGYYLWLIYIGTFISLLSIQSLILMRIAEYFTIFIILLLANFLSVFQSKQLRLLIYYLLFIISLIGIGVFLNQNLGGVLPYDFNRFK